MLFALTTTMYAERDVTRFLGIPVDGNKLEMIRKLERKGYVYDYQTGYLTGEFNGSEVVISVVTNNNKVYRILVRDANSSSEINIRIRFNNLCNQFANNSKYNSYSSDYTIPADEDISYEMTVNNKRYEAAFYQKPDTTLSAIDSEAFLQPYVDKLKEVEGDSILSEQAAKEVSQAIFQYAMNTAGKKSVWFMITEHYGQYYIVLYYDNKYNQANGEDL